MSSDLFVSLIIPIYNRAYCLRRCLNSVLYQSFTQWECVLVDDGSTDDTWTICREYGAQDTRFKIIHQENRGVSAARNRGLALVKGTWIGFVDSDDYLDKNYLRKLLEASSFCDLPICGLNPINNEAYESLAASFCEMKFSLSEIFEDSILKAEACGVLNTPGAKLYKQAIIKENGICFREDLGFGEDGIFNYTYFCYVDSVWIIPERLYNVVYTVGSLANQAYRFSLEEHLICLTYMRRFFSIKGLESTNIRLFLKNKYCAIIWMNLFFVRRKHGLLSVRGRYAYVRNLLRLVDRKCVDQAINYPFWKRFLMKQPTIYWMLSELKYILELK